MTRSGIRDVGAGRKWLCALKFAMRSASYLCYFSALLLVAGLYGCSPQSTPAPPPQEPAATPSPAPVATEPEPEGAQTKRADALQIARKAFASKGIMVGEGDVLKARFIKIAGANKAPFHYEWWVFIAPKKPIKGDPPSVYIHDKTGKVRIVTS